MRGTPAVRKERPLCSWRDGDMVFDLNRSKRGPGAALGRFPLGPGPHASVYLDRSAFHLDGNAAGAQIGVALKRVFDLGLDLDRVEHSFVWLSIQLGCNRRANVSDRGERLRLASNPGAQPG